SIAPGRCDRRRFLRLVAAKLSRLQARRPRRLTSVPVFRTIDLLIDRCGLGGTTRCPSCGKENRESAKFCGECGSNFAVETACPRCGASNPTTQKFCDGCGSSLNPVAATATPPHSPALPASFAEGRYQ